jgi:hypothetical protein
MAPVFLGLKAQQCDALTGCDSDKLIYRPRCLRPSQECGEDGTSLARLPRRTPEASAVVFRVAQLGTVLVRDPRACEGLAEGGLAEAWLA